MNTNEIEATPFSVMLGADGKDHDALMAYRGETFMQSAWRWIKSALIKLLLMAFAVWGLLVGVEVQKQKNATTWEWVVKKPADYAGEFLHKKGW